MGATELIKVWKDPDFDSKQRASYYGRATEMMHPHGTIYDGKFFGIKNPRDGPTSIQGSLSDVVHPIISNN